MNSRKNLLLILLATHFLPLATVMIFSGAYPDYPLWLFIAITAILAILFAGGWYYTLIKPLDSLWEHTKAAAAGNFLSTKRLPANGLFGPIVGNINKLIGKLQEALSRSQTEAEVIASEASRLRMILNSINDGVFALDKNKQVILFNKAAGNITGLSIEKVAGKHINDVLPFMKSQRAVIYDWITDCEGDDMRSQTWNDLSFKTEAGEQLSLDVEALYVGADPNGVRTLITFHNRTEEQQIEDMKVDFVALAAHELRTPVTIIRGYLEILDEEVGSRLDIEHQEFIHRLQISVSQLSGSINNILHVSHIEHGELSLNRETSDWKEIVEETCIELNKKAASQNKKLLINVKNDLPKVSVDRVSISEVITNLVDNAIKYSKRGQTVTVNVFSSDNTVITEVVDNGVGIPANAIGKLFTKFYRSHRTRTSHRGTGLGLYMSKALIEAHNGHIWVESKEGVGSTFGFELPVVVNDTDESDNSGITRGVHGWIKNHSLYRG